MRRIWDVEKARAGLRKCKAIATVDNNDPNTITGKWANLENKKIQKK